jgi:hypothetical protein
MSAMLLPVLRQFFTDLDGELLAGGQLFSYVAGTTTPAATYTDQSGSTPNSNPVVLDGSGSAEIWLGSGFYKFVLEDANGNVLWTVDGVSADGAGGSGLSSPWIKFSITDGQSPTVLTGATVDLSIFTSKVFQVEIIRGTTVISNGEIAIQNLNGVGEVVAGEFMAKAAHGVTWSVSQSGTVVQLLAACSAGPGAGSIKLNALSVPI